MVQVEKYNLIATKERLMWLDSILMVDDTPKFEYLAFDTETNGLQLNKATMVGFSVSFNSKSGFYIPLLKWVPKRESLKTRSVKKVRYDSFMDGHLECVWTGAKFDEFVTPEEYDLATRVPFIPFLIERWFSGRKLILHNAPFDVNMVFSNCGVDLKDSIFLDTSLLVHVLDENQPSGLKKAIERYRTELGINAHALAAIEKKEMDTSVLTNGGDPGQVWRADLFYQSKYACADTFLTYGLYKVALRDFANRFGDRGLNWFFEEEVMPVCREVVVDMKRGGVYVDVPHFEKLAKQNAAKMIELEDKFMAELNARNLLDGFTMGSSVDKAISNQRLIKKIASLENLPLPIKVDKKTGERKESLAKAEVSRAYEETQHWLWGYVLGEDELKYSESRIAEIKQALYTEIEGRRYRFNLGSGDHLTWLFCDRLGMDPKSLPQTESATAANPIPSMSAEVLEERMLPKFPWVSTLLKYRKLQKLQSTYILPVLKLNINGWLYMDMKQNGTTSGRFSCSGGFNLQTLPRVDDENELLEMCDKCDSKNVKISSELECVADRTCLDCGHVYTDIVRPSAIKLGFISPPGRKIINADYASLEPRCFAVVSGEEKIKDVYRLGLDLYSKVYCDVFDLAGEFSADPKAPNYLKKVAPAKRKWIKPIVLAIPYGSEDSQVANLMGAKIPLVKNGEIITNPDGTPVMVPNVKEGNRVRSAYLQAYGLLQKYMDGQDDQATTVGYVETLVGRRRHLPYAKVVSDILLQREIDWRDLVSAPVYELKKGPHVSYASKRGYRVTLTESMLESIKQALDLKQDSIVEKGYWAYVRSLLRADLNNAKNNPIQGLAGHITNRGMLDANRLFRARGIKALVCLQVHDEISCYADIADAPKAAEALQLGMEKNEFTKLIDIDMVAEPVICDNLKESK